MGDGPFSAPRKPGDTPGRASYGALAPMVGDMGQATPKSSDPYLTPPADGARGRGTPFLDPTPLEPLAGQQSRQSPSDAREKQPKWKAPATNNTPGWTSEQPHSGGKQSSDPLRDAVGSKSKMLIQARDLQRGSTTSKAIIAGTASGLLTEPLIKGMEILSDNGSKLEGEGALSRVARGTANLWRNNFDPVGISSSQIAKEQSLVAKSFNKIEATHALDKRLLNKLSAETALLPEETQHLVILKKGLSIKENKTLVGVLWERQKYLDPTILRTLNAAKTGEHLTTIESMEISSGGNMLTKTERGLLSTRQLALNNIVELKAAEKAAETETKWFSSTSAWENAKKSFLYTAGTGTVLAVDHSVRDRMYGENAPSWESSAFTVPLAIALGNGFKGKAGLTAIAVLGGHMLDNSVEAPSWIPDSLRHFSAFDAVPLGLAFAIPTKIKIAKTFLVGSAVLAGNGLESALESASAGDLEAQAVKTNVKDKTERTYSSFEKTVIGFKDLGKKNEIVLEQNLAQLLVDSNKGYSTMSQEDKLGAHRSTAALAEALGEYRLEKGTRLSAAATDKPTYILDGLGLDMGGASLEFLQLARLSVRGSRTMTEILMGKQAYGKNINQQEIVDLDKVSDKVNADIEKITGKHDMVNAMEKLKAFIDRGTTANGATFKKEMAFHKTFVDDINKKLGKNMPKLRKADGDLNPDAALLLSKLLRDQALAKMAQAAYKLDHGDDPIGAGQMIFGTPQGRNEWLPGTQNPKGFDGAIDALRLAERLSPDNPDLPELKTIATRLADQIKVKTPNSSP